MTPDAIAIRDAALALLSNLTLDAGSPPLPVPAFKHIGKVPVEQEPDEQLPSLLVIATGERLQPDGDLNTGQIQFINDLTLTILISLSGVDRDTADTRLSNRMVLVLTRLLTDVGFVSMIEGVSSANATRLFDKDGERFFARSRIDLVVQYRTAWAPAVDDLHEIDITTRQLGADPGGAALKTKITFAEP